MPEGRRLQQTASPPGRDETRSVNPLARNRWTKTSACGMHTQSITY